VEDFLRSEYGKPIVSNASLQLLLRQSTSSIAALEKTFGLSEAEKQLLVSANIGE
jgi:conjugal transfer ATP-binding protein TraC